MNALRGRRLPFFGSVLDRKLLRELRAARGMLAAIVLIVTVGVGCFVSMSSLYFNLEQSRTAYYSQCRMADFWIDVRKLPVAELDRLEDIAGIAEMRPRISWPITVDVPRYGKPVSGQMLSLPDELAPVINGVLLKRGGYFTQRRADEVIVNDAFARAHRIQPGDRLSFVLNNRRQSLLVAGTAVSSEFVYLLEPGGLVPDPERYGVFYVKQSFAEDVFDYDGACNQIVGLLAPEVRERPDRLLKQIEIRLEDFGVVGTTPRRDQPSHWFITSEIESLKVNVILLPAIFLSVAALILNVLMMRIAEQQRTIVGTLKALGYGDNAILLHFVKFGSAVGLAGGCGGLAVGYWLAGQMTALYREFYEFPQLDNRAYPGIMAAGMLVSVIFAVAGAYRGSRGVMLLSPAEAMRPRPPSHGRRILLERCGWLWSRLGFRWQMILRGILRQRLRSSAGMVAAAFGSMLIVVGLSSRDSMIEMVAIQFDRILLADFELSFRDDRDFGVVYEARHLPGTDLVEPLFRVGCTFRNGHREKKGALTGLIEEAQLTVPRDLEGRRVPVPPAGILLTRKLAEILDVRPGDVLTVEPVRGERREWKVQVAAVVDSYLGLAAYANYNYLNKLAGEQDAVSSLQLKVNPDRRQVQDFYRELKARPAVQTVTAVREQKRTLENVLVEKMMASILIIIAFAGLVFFGSVLNASLISLSERQQEIATLRVLGYTPREVGGIFLRESLLLNFLGTLLGFPLGYGLSLFMSSFYDTELFRLPVVFTPETLAATSALGLAFTLAAQAAVQRSINRMDWRMALNVKE